MRRSRFTVEQIIGFLKENAAGASVRSLCRKYGFSEVIFYRGKFRDECLNQHWFLNVIEAKQITEGWRQEYNEVRPHSSLGNVAPAEFARRVSRPHSITPQALPVNTLTGELA